MDAEQEPKDAGSEGQPSSESSGTPSTPPETYTREQVDQEIATKHSKLDKRLGELEKAGTRSTAALEAANRRTAVAEEALATVQVEKDRAELETAKGSPDALSLYTAKIAAREIKVGLDQREAALEASKTEHEAEITEARANTKVNLANTIARETGADASQLLNLTDGSEEKMRELAKVLPKGNAPASPVNPNIPDSGTGKGGGRKLSDMSDAELAALPDADYFTRRAAGEELKSS